MQTILLLKSAFLCVFRFFGLSSFDTVTTLILSRLASFLPFFEVIPEILRKFAIQLQFINLNSLFTWICNEKNSRHKLLASCAVSLALFSSCATDKTHLLPRKSLTDGSCFLMERHLDGLERLQRATLTHLGHVVDGCIQAKGDGSDASGYIVTDKEYENFELSWDWKLSKGAIAVCCTTW